MRNIIYSLILILMGIGIIHFGGMLRPYPAFGGEDLAGIAIIIAGIIPEKKEVRR